jgi:GNAT superfamily N-acetyltransferase
MTERALLRDGTAIEIRPLERSDRAGLAAAIDRLSPTSRYLRFASPKPTVSDRELDRLVDIDHRGREALLAFDPETGRGLGVARYAEVAGEDGVVDIAVTVADEWQGRGMGSALLARLIQRAGEEGHVVLRASVLAVNDASILMLRKRGFAARPSSGVLREYERQLPRVG